MDGVYDIIKHAGRIPLAELTLRSPESPATIQKSIELLVEKGLISVSGPMPSNPEEFERAKSTVIELTKRAILA